MDKIVYFCSFRTNVTPQFQFDLLAYGQITELDTFYFIYIHYSLYFLRCPKFLIFSNVFELHINVFESVFNVS